MFSSRYNHTSGYLDEVPVTSMWTSSNDTIVDILSLGLSSIITCNDSNYGIITRIRIPSFIALLCLMSLGFEKLNPVRDSESGEKAIL